MEKPLKENELQMVDVIIGLFKSLYQGNENAVKTDRILFELSQLHIPTSGSVLRNVIGHIRRNDLMAPAYIISDVGYGYWLSNDEIEMRDFLEKQLNRMANQFLNVKHLKQRITKSQKNTQEIQTQLF